MFLGGERGGRFVCAGCERVTAQRRVSAGIPPAGDAVSPITAIWLFHIHPAVHMQRDTGDISRAGTGQKSHSGGDIGG